MPGSPIRPWRSARVPQAVTVVALAAGLPLYLRSPLWCDITLYDVAARNLLQGGAHYRDVFDTNLPGFVWILTAVRWAFGFSAVAVRLVDLAFVAGVVLLVDRVARRGGATPAARWWAVAAVAVLYPSAVEMAHCQRDTWMALPAAAALVVRLGRSAGLVPARRAFALACAEGALWGAAVWIKPHCALMAAGVWLVTAWRVANATPDPRAGFAADLFGNLAGGLAVGLAGIVAVVAGGSGEGLREVLTVWAPEYAAMARRELSARYEQELHWFPPWSLVLVPTVPLAVLSVLDAAPWVGRPGPGARARPGPVGRLLPAWLWDREAGPDARFARSALAALYLVWAGQSFFIQRGYMYAHMAELFLMFGLWAAHRWAMPAAVMAWLAVTSALWLVGDAAPDFRARLLRVAVHDGRPALAPDKEHYLIRHPLADGERLRLWPACWRTDLTDRERYALWDRLRRITDHEAAFSWEELDEVAGFLRSKGVRDGGLVAWHDSPHVLYLMLDVKPGVRYMHVNTAQNIGPEARARVQAELAAAAGVARYAVSDLEYATLGYTEEKRLALLGPLTNDETLLPVALDERARSRFPYNQRAAVYRTRGGTGRYIIHELTPPLGDTRDP
jgi:hypothetical protein